MLRLLLSLLLLLSAYSGHSQATNQKLGLPRREETVSISAEQAAIIEQALKRFESLKPAYSQKALGYEKLALGSQRDSTLLIGNDKIIEWYRVTYAEEQKLRQDSNGKLQVAQGKARRRGWLVALETAMLALGGYVLVTK
jgi:hypothetical protein